LQRVILELKTNFCRPTI